MLKFFGNKEELHAIWRIIPSTTLTEIIAQSGFDFQILDCEHGAYDYVSLESDIRGCAMYNCGSLVRVSGLNKVEVQRCLDLGADGIVFPQLNNYEDFEQAVKLLYYAPQGVRGYNPFVRVAGYGIQDKNEKVKPLCIPIIETLQAITDLDRILTLEGIDALYIGSYDLSAQLECIGEMDAPELLDTVNLIIEKCKAASKPVALMIGNREQYRNYKNRGTSIFVHAVDSLQLKRTFKNVISQYII